MYNAIAVLDLIRQLARKIYCPVGRGVRHPTNECPVYDTKQSDGEVPVMLGLWGMQNNLSLPLLPDPLWPGVVAPDWALSMG